MDINEKGLTEAAREVLGIKESIHINKKWITKNMQKKMDEQRKWKNVRNEEGKRRYRALNNEL